MTRFFFFVRRVHIHHIQHIYMHTLPLCFYFNKYAVYRLVDACFLVCYFKCRQNLVSFLLTLFVVTGSLSIGIVSLCVCCFTITFFKSISMFVSFSVSRRHITHHNRDRATQFDVIFISFLIRFSSKSNRDG